MLAVVWAACAAVVAWDVFRLRRLPRRERAEQERKQRQLATRWEFYVLLLCVIVLGLALTQQQWVASVIFAGLVAVAIPLLLRAWRSL